MLMFNSTSTDDADMLMIVSLVVVLLGFTCKLGYVVYLFV